MLRHPTRGVAVLIAVKTDIIIEVEDAESAEEASSVMDTGLANQLHDFPEGEVVSVKVSGWEPVSDEVARENGWVE
jgi:hypothetical protein